MPTLLVEQAQVKLREAIALHQQGLLKEAESIYRGILNAQPEHFDALHLLGVLANQTGNHHLAADLIGMAIAVCPDNAAFYSNRGNALQELKQLDAAVASYDRATAIRADFAAAYYNRGNALKERKSLDAAVASYDRAIAINAEYAETYSNRGLALQELKQPDAAVASYERAIAIKPDFAEAYSNRGNALKELKQLDAAVASYDRATAIKADYAEAYSNRGLALRDLEQPDAAVASYARAIAIKPDFAEVHANRGVALHALRQLSAALASYDRALTIKPDLAEAHWNKSLSLLLRGDFERGWKLNEWRWEGADSSKKQRRNFKQPLWLGAESISDKAILLHSEQGLGDTIQFCRYVKSVAALGARVILEVPKPLFALLSQLDGVSELIVRDTTLPAFDCHCPLLSLPLAFKTNHTDIPSSKSYLSSDGSKVSIWTDRLGRKTKPRIGIAWSGSDLHKSDHRRSIVLSSFLPYLSDAFEYVSLQKEVRDIDKITLGAHRNIRHFGDELDDFTDTAALCELMDVVISVDTSVAHLSGALGKRTWVLLPYVPDWRWLLDRDDTPWYPSLKLYRQAADRDWAKVFERVARELNTARLLYAGDSRSLPKRDL